MSASEREKLDRVAAYLRCIKKAETLEDAQRDAVLALKLIEAK